MSGPPPPPRRRKPNPVTAFDNSNSNNVNNNNVKSSTKQLLSPIKTLSKDESIEKIQIVIDAEYSNKQIEIPASIIAYNEFTALLNDTLEPDQIPETVIGPGVDVRGNMQFERLLRVEGKFQGTIISQGDLVIGRHGCLIANVLNLRTVTVNGGKIIGDINVEKIILRKGSIVDGNIICKIFVSEKFVAVNGTCNIHTLAPETIDSNGDIIIPVPEIEVGQPLHVQHDKKKGKKKKGIHDIDVNENPVPIEEQKNKLKADKQLRREQIKLEESIENHETDKNFTIDNTVSKRKSINSIPTFSEPIPTFSETESVRSVSPRLIQKRDTVKIEPLSNLQLNSLSSRTKVKETSAILESLEQVQNSEEAITVVNTAATDEGTINETPTSETKEDEAITVVNTAATDEGTINET